MKKNAHGNFLNGSLPFRGTVLGVLIAVIFVTNCSMEINAPASMRFPAEIAVIDTSLHDADSLVTGADVVMQSVSYGDRYESVTNSRGVAVFNGLIPDSYNIMATGKRVDLSGITNINGQLQDTSLYIEEDDTLRLKVNVRTSRSSALLISEIYYCGAVPDPVPQYFHDQFLEIYNNSNATLYLDSLIIADAEYGYYDDSLLHAIHAYMFPGDGDDYPIGPGEFIVIAQDAIDHSQPPIGSVNLLNADFEYYLPDKGDVNNPDVTNMIQVHHKYGIDFLYSVFSDALVILQVDNPYKYGYDEHECLLLPKSGVIDGVDYRDDPSETDRKRLDPGIDGGLTGGVPSYSSQSVERKVESLENGRIIFMDNNNSTLDFHILSTPTPGFCNTEVSE